MLTHLDVDQLCIQVLQLVQIMLIVASLVKVGGELCGKVGESDRLGIFTNFPKKHENHENRPNRGKTRNLVIFGEFLEF